MIIKTKIKKIKIYDNQGKYKSIDKIKAETGCDIVFNGGLFNSDFTPCCHLKIDGQILATDQYSYWGYGWNDNPVCFVSNSNNIYLYKNYIACIFALRNYIKEPLNNNQSGIGGSRGRTAFGFTKDSEIVILCSKDGTENYKLTEVQDIMLEQGCEDAIILDGGGSSQIRSNYGNVNTSRIVSNYICVWEDKEIELNPQDKEEEKVTETKGKPNLFKQLATKNKCYITGTPLQVKGLMLHSTGANNTYLKRYVQPDDGQLGENPYGNSFNEYQPNGSVCVHGFIGKLQNGDIASYQILPWDMQAWHCGSGKNGTANHTHIGVEICEDGLTDSVYFNKVYNEAVQLFAYLCEKYNLTENDIICHSEGCEQGIASNHGDVMHWFPKHGKSMDTFREDVKNVLNGSVVEDTLVETIIYRVQIGAFTTKSYAESLELELKTLGYDTIIKTDDNIYRVQIGAFTTKEYAENLEKELIGLGYKTIIKTIII